MIRCFEPVCLSAPPAYGLPDGVGDRKVPAFHV